MIFKIVLLVKNLPASAGDIRDVGSILGLGRSPGEGHGSPLQYCCLENPYGQRRLVSYSPWGHRESDTTEVTEHSHKRKAQVHVSFFSAIFTWKSNFMLSIMISKDKYGFCFLLILVYFPSYVIMLCVLRMSLSEREIIMHECLFCYQVSVLILRVFNRTMNCNVPSRVLCTCMYS